MNVLSIGIPTYNRSGLITSLLDNLCEQCAGELSVKVDILISDNASTDCTPHVIEQYVKKHPELIRYHRNRSNIGFSANVDSAVRHARGKHVLIMSDDDDLDPHAIRDLVSTLEKHPDVSLALLSSQTWDKAMSRPTVPFKQAPNTFFSDGAEFILNTRAFPSALISGYVVERSKWIALQPERFFDINSIHFIMGPLLMANTPIVLMNERPYVKYRSDMGHWCIENDPLYPFPMFVSYLKGCQAIRPIYPASIHEVLYCSTIRTTIGHVIRNKVLGYTFPRKDIQAILTPYLETSTFRCRIFTTFLNVALHIPRCLLYIPFRWLVPEKL